MTRMELRASRVDATKKAQATRKRNMQFKANGPTSRQGRKRARGKATKATSEELSEVFGSDAGTADGCSDEDSASDAGKATNGTADGSPAGSSNNTTAPTAPPCALPPSGADGSPAGRGINTTAPTVPPRALPPSAAGGSPAGSENNTTAPTAPLRALPPSAGPAGTGRVDGGGTSPHGTNTTAAVSPACALQPLTAPAGSGRVVGGLNTTLGNETADPTSSLHASPPDMALAGSGGNVQVVATLPPAVVPYAWGNCAARSTGGAYVCGNPRSPSRRDQDAVACALEAVSAAVNDTLQHDDAPSPSLTGFAGAIAGLGASDLKDARAMPGANPDLLPSFDGGPINEADEQDGPIFPGEEFLYDGSEGGGGDTLAARSRPGGGKAVSAVLEATDSAHESAPSRFPRVPDAALQQKYAAERRAWRACFADWGVSWEDDLHAEVVELFTRAKDISPSYIIHYASAKVMSDAPATRSGVQDWFSCLLNATMQGVPAAAEQPLCRVRRAHVLTVITAAYATYGFNLPESVNARPDALSVGRRSDVDSLVHASDGYASLPTLPLAVAPGQRPAADAPRAQVARADPAQTHKKSGKSVGASKAEMGRADGAAEAGSLESKGRHDRTMVRMMTAVGIMLTYFNPETKKWPSVHDVFMRMPSNILKGMSEASIGLMVSSWRWARRGNKGREMRTYDQLHIFAMTKPGVMTDADALQYVVELHAVMMGDRFWRYKHVTRISGSVAIPWEEWLAEAESWVPSLDADRAGLPRPPPPPHEREAEMLAFAAERKEAPVTNEET